MFATDRRLLIGINGFIVSTVAVDVVVVVVFVVVIVAVIIYAHVVVFVDSDPSIDVAAAAFVLDCLAGDCDQSPMVKGDMMEYASIAIEYGSSGDFFDLSRSRCKRLLRDFESHCWLVKLACPIAILVVNLI